MGRKPDRSIIDIVFGKGDSGKHTAPVKTSTRPKAAIKKPSKGKTTPARGKRATAADVFKAKLKDEDFHEFDHKDWLKYFVMKADEQGIRYIVGNAVKDYAIIKALMNELNYPDIKGMIDFIFESDQDITPKETAGVFLLSKGWINTMYQNSLLWRNGKYTPRNKKAPVRTREWVASRKDAGAGISYGKPIRDSEPDEEEVEPRKENGKSSRVFL